MTKAQRILQLAQEVASSYNILGARRSGSGDLFTREVIDHLKLVVNEEFGAGVANQFLSWANRQSVDFWLEDEQTIIEVEFGMLTPVPVLECAVFKALLAQDAGKDVRQLVLVCDPGSIQRYEASTPRSILDWVERHHRIHVEIWELTENRTVLPALATRDDRPQP